MPMEYHEFILNEWPELLAIFSAEQHQEGKYQHRIVI